ncbi:MAG: DNA recombination protein RmuC, partial [Gammaproteobacteria bacterium]
MAELIPSGLDTQLVTMIAVFAGGLLLGVLLAMLVALRKQGHDKARIAALETQVKQEERLEAERDEAIELARERLAATFETLAGKSLQTSTQQFLQLARENLGGFQTRAEASFEAREKAIEDLVRPISEALKKTESQIHEIEKDRREAFGQIQQFLQHMGDTQVQLQTETA